MRIRVTLLSVLALVIGLSVGVVPTAQAETLTFPCGPNGETYTVLMPAGVAIDGKYCSGNLIIDNSVKIIGSSTFYGANITSLILPNTVNEVGTGSFAYTNIKSVIIPNSVKTIGYGAFERTPLEDVKIGNSVINIGHGAFAWTHLQSITLPDSLVNIGDIPDLEPNGIVPGAFQGSRLNKIVIPNSVFSIGDYAFANTPITDLLLGESVAKIGRGAFGLTLITKLRIPDSVVRIDDGAFSTSKLNQIIFGKSLAILRSYVFAANNLTTAEIPPSVTTIEDGAFSYNAKLLSVTIPDSVIFIGDKAFAENILLATVSMSENISYLGSNVFQNNYSLSKIIYCGKEISFPITPICPPEKQAVINKSALDKSAAELKAKQEADAKAAAELKAKQEADAKAAAELKAKEEAYISKINRDNAINGCLSILRTFDRTFQNYLGIRKWDQNNARFPALKLKYSLPETKLDEKLCETDTEATLKKYNLVNGMALESELGLIANEIVEKQKAAAELKAKQDAAAKAAAAKKKTTITCIKGKLTKKVTAVKPVCPKGYKKKA